MLVAVSHAGVDASVQSLFIAHCTHAPATHAPLPHSELASHFVEHMCSVVQNSDAGQSACDAHASLLFEFELELEQASGTATSAASAKYCVVMFPFPFEVTCSLLHKTRSGLIDETCRPGATCLLGTSVSMRDLVLSGRID
ncbi:MAG TPA: hypothetical protein VGG28_16795 [Kofleriaceae bacterium]